MSNNGEKVCSLAEANQLMIMSTCIEHKWIHKATWVLPDNKTMNQIDTLVNIRRKSAIQDVRTYHGPNCDSDHWMVMAKIKQRISMYYSQPDINSKKWNLQKIQDKKELQLYQDKIRQELNGKEEQDDINEDWQNIKESIIIASEQILGKKKDVQNEGWFDQDCKDAIAEKKKLKQISTKWYQTKKNTKGKEK